MLFYPIDQFPFIYFIILTDAKHYFISHREGNEKEVSVNHSDSIYFWMVYVQ